MTEHFRFFDAQLNDLNQPDREYNAGEFTDYFKALVTTGLMKGAGNQLKVATSGNNMISTIDTGIAFILGKYYENDSLLSHTHDTETLGRDRIDRIVIRLDGNTDARYVKSFVKKGVPSASPMAPTLTQTSTIYEISLAQVKVVGGQTFIEVADIVDERGRDIICPWAGSNILPNFDEGELAQIVDLATNAMSAISIGDTTQDPDTTENSLIITNHVNVPFFNRFCYIYTSKYSGVGGNISQIAVTYNGSPSKMAFRNKFQGVFQPWEEVVTTKLPAWSLATLAAGWRNGSGGEILRYYKDSFGVVHLSGTVENTQNTSLITTLPLGYRPDSMVRVLAGVDNPVQINTNGTVHCVNPVGSFVFIHLSFRTDW